MQKLYTRCQGQLAFVSDFKYAVRCVMIMTCIKREIRNLHLRTHLLSIGSITNVLKV